MAVVGRDAELAMLREQLLFALDGRGQAILLTGPTGVGKTELLRSFITLAQNSGATVLSAVGWRAERDLPLGVIAQLFGGTLALSGYYQQATGLLRRGGIGTDAAEGARTYLIHELSAAVLELIAEHPVVLVVDDVHYADDLSVQILLRLNHKLGSTPVLLVLAELSGTESGPVMEAGLLCQPNRHRVELTGLSSPAVRELLSIHLDPALATRLTPSYLALSGGNPLLLTALIKDAMGGPATPPNDQTVAGREFRAAVLACLRRSDPATQRVARAVAALDGAPLELLGQVLDTADIHQPLRLLTAAGLLDDKHRFRHAAARAAIIGDTSAELLADIHQKAATILHHECAPPAVIATHLAEIPDALPPWACGVLRDAAEVVLAEGDVQRCADYLTLALTATTDHRAKAAIFATLWQVEWRTRPAVALRRTGQLVTAATQGDLPVQQAAALVRRLLCQGATDRAVTVLTELVKSADLTVPAVTAQLQLLQMWLAGTFPPVHDRLTRVLPANLPDIDDPTVAISPPAQAAVLLAAWLGVGPADKVAQAEQILLGCPLNDRTIETLSAALVSTIYRDRSDFALQLSERLLPQAAQCQAPGWQATLAGHRAEVALRQGDLAGAEHYVRFARALVPLKAWAVANAGTVATLVQALTRMGRHDEVAELLAEPVPDAVFESRYGLLYLRARGLHYLAVGWLYAALANFGACSALMTAWRLDIPALVPWRSDTVEALLQLGKREQASQLAHEQLEMVSAQASRTHGITLRVAAACTTDLTRKSNLLRQAVDMLNNLGDRFALAQALADLSEVQQLTGDQNRARRTGRRARQLMEQCNARSDLRSAGGAPAPRSPGRQAAGPAAETLAQLDALSGAELRVASLAAQGLTNREIAQELYITASTVEQHLTRIYRKLKVSRRTSLPAKLQLMNVNFR